MSQKGNEHTPSTTKKKKNTDWWELVFGNSGTTFDPTSKRKANDTCSMHSHCAKCTVTAQNYLGKNPSQNWINVGASWRSAVSRNPAHFFDKFWNSVVMGKKLDVTMFEIYIHFFCKHQDFIKSTDQGTFNLHIKLWRFSFWRKFEFKVSSACAKYMIRMLWVSIFFDNLGVQKISWRALDGNCLEKTMKLFKMVGMDLFISLFLCTQWMERLFHYYSRWFFEMAQQWLDHM
jgi:hypothetical protein